MKPDDIRNIRHKLELNRHNFGKLIGVVGRTVEQYELGTARPSRAVQLHIMNLIQNKNVNACPS